MADHEERVVIATIPAAIAWGISATGLVPRLWGRKPIPAVRRNNSTDTDEPRLRRLFKLHETPDRPLPDDFVLLTMPTMGKPVKQQGNPTAMREGVRVATDAGQRHTLKRTPVSFTLSANMYSTDFVRALEYGAMLMENPTFRGYIPLDGLNLPVSAAASSDLSFTDPVSANDSSVYLDRLYNVAFTLTIDTTSATLSRSVLVKSLVFQSLVEGEPEHVVKIITNQDDWGI